MVSRFLTQIAIHCKQLPRVWRKNALDLFYACRIAIILHPLSFHLAVTFRLFHMRDSGASARHSRSRRRKKQHRSAKITFTCTSNKTLVIGELHSSICSGQFNFYVFKVKYFILTNFFIDLFSLSFFLHNVIKTFVGEGGVVRRWLTCAAQDSREFFGFGLSNA